MKTKQDFVNALVELGHDKADLETMTLSELKSLHAESTETHAPVVAVAPVDPTPATSKSKDIVVFTKVKGVDTVFRTFSERIHGKDFADLAKQFMSKFGNKYYTK